MEETKPREHKNKNNTKGIFGEERRQRSEGKKKMWEKKKETITKRTTRFESTTKVPHSTHQT